MLMLSGDPERICRSAPAKPGGLLLPTARLETLLPEGKGHPAIGVRARDRVLIRNAEISPEPPVFAVKRKEGLGFEVQEGEHSFPGAPGRE